MSEMTEVTDTLLLENLIHEKNEVINDLKEEIKDLSNTVGNLQRSIINDHFETCSSCLQYAHEIEHLKAELVKEISYPREKEEPLQGWTLSFDFLKSIQENIEEDGYGIDLEIIEQVMLAHEKLARQTKRERNESE